MERRNNENVETTANETIGILETLTEVPTKPEDVVPLNIDKALASYTEAERKEIMDLANQIDAKKVDNLMNYASNVLLGTFDACGEFLKNEKGSAADQEVIKKVIELSQKAGDSNEDFNLALKEPSLFQKFLLKLSKGARKERMEKIQESAVTNYQLLTELKKSCESWIEMLVEAMSEISVSGKNDVEQAILLEKYIIAGKIAEKRIREEISEIQKNAQETGLQKYEQEYAIVKEGYDIFEITMANLEKSRVMYRLSIGQLALIKKSNRNVQIAIRTQVNNSMALMAQQLRNAVLNAKTKEVLEGQKAMTRLNDELIKEISTSIGMTAEDTEKILYTTFYNTDAAKKAVETVINSCNEIQKVAEEMLPKMKAETEEITKMIEQLEPAVTKIATNKETTATLNEKPASSGAGSNTGLKF